MTTRRLFKHDPTLPSLVPEWARGLHLHHQTYLDKDPMFLPHCNTRFGIHNPTRLRSLGSQASSKPSHILRRMATARCKRSTLKNGANTLNSLQRILPLPLCTMDICRQLGPLSQHLHPLKKTRSSPSSHHHSTRILSSRS